MLPLVLLLALSGCQRHSENNALHDDSCKLGIHLYDQKISGFIYGELGAKVRIDSCPGSDISFVFIKNSQPESYTKLNKISSSQERVVGFSAIGNGYIVLEDKYRKTFLVVGLDSIEERPDLVKDAENKSHLKDNKP